MVDQVFDTFTNSDAAALRASRGIQTQSPSAPHGALDDNAACALLRVATLKLLRSRGDSLPEDTDMSFLRLGAYVGVFVSRPAVAAGAVVAGTEPLYVFQAGELPPSGGERGFQLIAELRF